MVSLFAAVPFRFPAPLNACSGHRTTKSRKSGTPKQPLYGATRTEGFGDEVQRRIMLGTFVLQAKYVMSLYAL